MTRSGGGSRSSSVSLRPCTTLRCWMRAGSTTPVCAMRSCSFTSSSVRGTGKRWPFCT
ncbi:hypothetical protein ACFQY5_07180 [Paeniroseomonas aquatica]|uniref:hypothetical protein n=1 Tax=Paeniroseomonas aquatica TaxID=373043 RepID=UPI003623D78C